MARISDLNLLEAEIKEAGLDAKNKTAELIDFLKQKTVTSLRIAKKATKATPVK